MIGPLLAAVIAAAPLPADAAPAPAAATASEGVTPYPTSFFTAGNPSNALDMIQRLPGFTFAAGDAVRGFASAAGNVLIDGQRPTSKATSLDDALRRIPAESVVRIDLIRGGAAGIDMQGYAVLANVVRSTAAVTDATATIAMRLDPDGNRLGPRGEVIWSQRRGKLALNLGLTAFREVDVSSVGEGTQTRRAVGGRISESGPVSIDAKNALYQLTGGAVLTGARDILRFNGALSRSRPGYYEQVGVVNAAGLRIGTDRSISKTVSDKLEFGGDYERTFKAGLTGRILALQTLTNETRDGVADSRGFTALIGEGGKSGESIVRATATKPWSSALTFEGGGEAAFNFLDASSSRIAGGVPVVLPNANVRIEERRGEVFFKVSYRPGPRFSADFEPRAEYSEISQTGDTNSARTFFFPKPRLIGTWSPSATRQVRFRFEREIGQLNFKDFAASSALDAGTVNVGNANLEPERAWVAEGAVEQRFWARGSVVVTYRHAWISQVVDLIPIAGAFDAPGNIGKGTKDEVAVSIAVPLDRLGIKGGLIRGTGTRRWSQVSDPVTFTDRRISGQRPFEGDFHFSQDLPKLKSSWGIDYLPLWRETFYRINEVRTNVKGDFISAFWEWRPRRDLAIRLDVNNFTDRSRVRKRNQFIGSRANAVLAYTERRAWDSNPFFNVRIRKIL